VGPLLVITGPTASGKSALAETLADRHPLVLLSADSQLVYRGLDIGTAKPARDVRPRWGLVDLVDPGQAFSAGEFCRQAVPLAQAAWGAGRIPALVGGTGLYLKALLEGLAEIPAVAPEVRQRLAQELLSHGLEALAARLDRVDPDLAQRVDRRNPRRVLRALEVFEASGVPLSRWQALSKPALSVTRSFSLALDPGPEVLEGRIRERINENFRDGWLDEVRRLKEEWGAEAVGKCAAIGYPELLRHLDGSSSLEAAQDSILTQTRRYARRQRTWFKAQAGLHWHAGAAEALADPALDNFFL
jgi:tRNA dimethylallyltransferase